MYSSDLDKHSVTIDVNTRARFSGRREGVATVRIVGQSRKELSKCQYFRLLPLHGACDHESIRNKGKNLPQGC